MRNRLYSLAILISAPLAFLGWGLLRNPPANPEIRPEVTIEANLPVPPRVHDMLRRACYDCHSSGTRWPWYSTVPPVSGQIQEDVRRGRAALNFSEWATGAGRTPGRAASTLTVACLAVEQHRMPKPPYSLMHAEAQLTDEDIEFFCSWTREQIMQLRASARKP